MKYLAAVREATAERTVEGLLGEAAAIERGWGLSGPGPARFGWWRRWQSGALDWLGRTATDAGLT